MESVHRTARVGLRVTKGQARRCFALLRSAGDVWAALIDVNAYRFAHGARPVANYQEWCREVAGVACGELSVTAVRSVVRRYSEAFFETAQRRRRGERARYPRRKRALFPVRWYHGTFVLHGRRVRLSVAGGQPELWLRLGREIPYPTGQLRSVTLVCEAGRLFLDVTSAVPVAVHDIDPGRVAGVDVGIIHPFAAASGDAALFVSGRAIRAEERLHLADTKARASHMGRKAPRRGQRGSRRWRKLRAAQRRAETKHRRRVRLAHHQAAKSVVTWALERRVGTSGGTTRTSVRVTHRRAGHVPARRDRRRHLWDQRRSSPAPGRPVTTGESLTGEPNRSPRFGDGSRPYRWSPGEDHASSLTTSATPARRCTRAMPRVVPRCR